MNETCFDCLSGKHENCMNNIVDFEYCTCSHTTIVLPTPPVGSIQNALNLQTQALSEEEEPDRQAFKRRLKSDDALKDQQSTGRKRAAQLYPLDREAECEWAMLPAAGGGFAPIQGCGLRPQTLIGRQQARHHGPDQNTLNNDPGNVHRICHACHNSWHTANDKYKDQMYEKIYGHRPAMEDLSHASKVLKSGIVNQGIPDKD